MKKITLSAVSIVYIATSYIAPHVLAMVFLNITGHPKGYGYDVGEEKGFYMVLGVLLLTVWVVSLVLTARYIYRKLSQKCKYSGWVMFACFLLTATISIVINGGFEYFFLQFK